MNMEEAPRFMNVNYPSPTNVITYNDCTADYHFTEWCYTGKYDHWVSCKPRSDMMLPDATITTSEERTCTDNSLHVCNAQANYGGTEVDWNHRTVTMSIFNPHEQTLVAGSVSIPL